MKLGRKRAVSGMLACGVVLSCLATSAFASGVPEQTVLSAAEGLQRTGSTLPFTDVPADAWYYNTVAKMVQDGLLTGTSDTTFSPDAPMTEMQFLTVVLRKAFPDELKEYNEKYPQPWYEGAFQLAMSKEMLDGLVYGETQLDEYPGAVFYPMFYPEEMAERPITRERMMDMVITAMELKQESLSSDVEGVIHHVSDLDQCTYSLRPNVMTAYTMGIVTGKGDGRVDPMGTGTRAEGAAILYRFAYPEARVLPDLTFTEAPVDLSQPITIYEGQLRFGDNSRLAQEGDIFVKKDGTEVILTKGPHGVLGEGQGVAPDVGFWSSYSSFASGYKVGFVPEHGKFQTFSDNQYYDSLGNYANGQEYHVDPWTGEGHWFEEWDKLMEGVTMPAWEGTYDGQLGPDGFWVWDGLIKRWNLRFKYPSTDIFEN